MAWHARKKPGEAFYRDICESAAELIVSVDPDGRILYANEACLETLSWRPRELAWASIFDLVHPGSLDEFRALFGALLRDGAPVRVDASFRSRDGREIPVEGSLSSRVERGAPAAVRGIFRDVTEHRRVQRDLDRLFRLSLDVLCVAGFDGYFRQVNPSFERVLGWTEADLEELRFLDLVHPDDRRRARRELTNLPAGRVILDFECRYRAKDGSWKTLVWRATPLPERELVYVNARDISEERRMAAVVVRQGEDLDRLFEMSKDLLCVAGVDGYFKRINPAFETVLGYSADELLSKQFIEFVHPDDRPETIREVERLAAGQPTIDFHNRYLARDGGWRWLQWRATPMPDRGLIYAIARDATEQVLLKLALERQAGELARSNADLEQFAAVASHDLRAPLRHVAQLADWIEQDMPDALPGRVAEHLRTLRDHVGRMERLTEDLLLYARADFGAEERERVDAAELVRAVATTLAPPDGFEVRAGPGLPVLDTERAPLEQVLRNLVGNAIAHHDRDAGMIVVDAETGGGAPVFTVTDDGPGIAARDHAAVFEMFRTTGAGRRGEGGTGIGLAIVKKLVEARGGEISVEDAPGRGARFRFSWPDAPEAADGARPPD